MGSRLPASTEDDAMIARVIGIIVMLPWRALPRPTRQGARTRLPRRQK
jgi:hypothetical protein